MGHYDDIIAKKNAELVASKRLELKKEICKWIDDACLDDLQSLYRLLGDYPKIIKSLREIKNAFKYI